MLLENRTRMLILRVKSPNGIHANDRSLGKPMTINFKTESSKLQYFHPFDTNL